MPTQRGGAFWSTSNDYTNVGTESGVSSGILRYLMYILSLIVVVLVVLIVIHFTITPIFRTNPGEDGVISLPGSDDSLWYWKVLDQNLPIINEKLPTPLVIPSANYTYMLDINIDGPSINPYPGKPRILFARANNSPDYGASYFSNSEIRTLFPPMTTVNTIVSLDQLTNDLTINVYADDGSPMSIVLPNVPTRTGFQLAVVVGSKFVEAYINGKLTKTLTYTKPPIELVNGLLIPPGQVFMNTTLRVMNLRIWRRILNPQEIRGYSGNIPKFSQGPLMMDSTPSGSGSTASSANANSC